MNNTRKFQIGDTVDGCSVSEDYVTTVTGGVVININDSPFPYLIDHPELGIFAFTEDELTEAAE